MVKIRYTIDEFTTTGCSASSWLLYTSGAFCIEVNGHTLFEMRPEFESVRDKRVTNSFKLHYVPDYVGKFLLALIRVAPLALEEVPADLVRYLSPEGLPAFYALWKQWLSNADRKYDLDDPIWHEHDLATSWIAARVVDCDHLPGRPLLWLWSYNKQVHWCWDFRDACVDHRPIYTATSGIFSQPVDDFRDTIKDFSRSLLGHVQRHVGSNIEVSLQQVEKSVDQSISVLRQTDWASVCAALHGASLELPRQFSSRNLTI